MHTLASAIDNTNTNCRRFRYCDVEWTGSAYAFTSSTGDVVVTAIDAGFR